jgi:hypothetical protein
LPLEQPDGPRHGPSADVVRARSSQKDHRPPVPDPPALVCPRGASQRWRRRLRRFRRAGRQGGRLRLVGRGGGRAPARGPTSLPAPGSGRRVAPLSGSGSSVPPRRARGVIARRSEQRPQSRVARGAEPTSSTHHSFAAPGPSLSLSRDPVSHRRWRREFITGSTDRPAAMEDVDERVVTVMLTPPDRLAQFHALRPEADPVAPLVGSCQWQPKRSNRRSSRQPGSSCRRGADWSSPFAIRAPQAA